MSLSGWLQWGERIVSDARHMTSQLLLACLSTCQPSGGLTRLRLPSELTSLLAAHSHTPHPVCPDNISAQFYGKLNGTSIEPTAELINVGSFVHAWLKLELFCAMQEKVRLTVLQMSQVHVAINQISADARLSAPANDAFC